MTKFLLKTLSDETNPITHSDIGERSGIFKPLIIVRLCDRYGQSIDYVFSTSTGHEISEGRKDRKLYSEDRKRKLGIQQTDTNSNIQVLKNVRIYINGFLEDTTDIEMKKVVIGAGGQIL